MNSKHFFAAGILAIIVCMASGCAKLGNGPSMNWSYGTYTIADSAFCPATNPPNTEILAYGSQLEVLQIETSTKMSVGTYTLHTVTPGGSYLYLYTPGNPLNSQSGTLTVTYNDNTKMSGSFSATFTNGQGVTGSFSNIPIR